MPAGPILSGDEVEKIKNHLHDLCKQSWILKGYKKTNIKELCEEVKISIGTFYKFYPSKEDLFLAALLSIQKEITKKFCEGIQEKATIIGFVEETKKLVRTFYEIPFLYEANNPDFVAFITKLSNERIEEIKNEQREIFRNCINESQLKLKMGETQAMGIINILVNSVSAKNVVSETVDYFLVVDFMIEQLIPTIFEED